MNMTELFIQKAKLIHGDKYDYSKVNYINNNIKINIICKIHGDFEQSPSKHLSGQNCSKCSCVYKPTNNEFIEKLKIIHGDRYDYSKVDYKKCHDKIIIICKAHGDYEQTASSHLSGNNCPICVGGVKYNTEEFINKAIEIHGDKYDYSKVDYINSANNIIIICKTHGEFEQKPPTHLTTGGCSKCGTITRSNKRKTTSEDFIIKAINIHGDKYDYSKVIYENAKSKIIIKCNKHGEFSQSPDGHLAGKGCKKCAKELNIINQSFTTSEFVQKAKKNTL